MYNVLIHITINQVGNVGYPNRNKELSFEFAESFEWNSSWKNMTDKGKFTIPKNLFYRDKYGQLLPLDGSAVNIGGLNNEPLFMRGDKVKLTSGYSYILKNGTPVSETTEIFRGYISNVNSGIPVEIEVEDNMWLLKQTALTNRTFTSSDTLESILSWVISQVNDTYKTSLTYKSLAKTNFGAFVVNNETASQLLDRLHKLYGFSSYFRGDELRCGSLIYVESDAQTQIFIMNGQDGNVCAENQQLEYQRKDDVVLSAIAHNTITKSTGATTKDGKSKTKKERLEVLVTIRNGKRTDKVIAKGEQKPSAGEGERKEFFFISATTTQQLADLAYDKLIQYYYDGLKGKFTVWGIPYVRHGDWCDIRNPKQVEQNGVYKIKGVEYSGGTSGLRQVIELDFKQSLS